MELSDRERDVTMMALMLYATGKPNAGHLSAEYEREVADRAIAKEAYYHLLCDQAGVK